MRYASLFNGNNISNIFASCNLLSNASNSTEIDTKDFNAPLSRVNNTLSLLYIASLNRDGTGKLIVY